MIATAAFEEQGPLELLTMSTAAAAALCPKLGTGKLLCTIASHEWNARAFLFRMRVIFR
jgi:hypothetical protein